MYLSVTCVLACEPVQSRVWLLTLTFIGGSGGEGSAKVKGSEKKSVKIKKDLEMPAHLPARQCFSDKIMAACVQLTGKTCANEALLSHCWSPTVPRAEALKLSKDLAKTNWG